MGEIARAAAIFEVDEIVVYDDLSVSRKGQGGVRDDSASVAAAGGFNRGGSSANGSGGGGGGGDRNNPNVFMARLLQVRHVITFNMDENAPFIFLLPSSTLVVW